MSYQELVLKLLDGVKDAPMRADVAATASMLVELYIMGKIDDRKLMASLKELITDVMLAKNPFKTADEIKDEVDKWVDAIYRAIKIKAVKMRLGAD